MNHAVFVKNTGGAGIGGLSPTWIEWEGVGGATSIPAPTVTASSSVTGLYTFSVTATNVPIFGRLDFGSSVTDVAQRYREFVFQPSDGVVTPTRAAALDEVTGARMGRLDNAGLDSVTASRAANLDQINSTRMGLIDGLTSTRTGNLDNIGSTRMGLIDGLTTGRTGNLDNIGGTRMANLDGLGSAVGAIGSAVVTIDGVVDGIAAGVTALPGGVWSYPMPESPVADSVADYVATTDARVWAFTISEVPVIDVLTAAIAQVCTCVWNKPVAAGDYNPETMGWAMQCMLAMTTKGNALLQEPVYDGDKLTGVKIRLFKTAAAKAANNGGHLLEVTVAAGYTGDNLTTFGGVRPAL